MKFSISNLLPAVSHKRDARYLSVKTTSTTATAETMPLENKHSRVSYHFAIIQFHLSDRVAQCL